VTRATFPPDDDQRAAWAEYSYAAEYAARRRMAGETGYPLPPLMSVRATDLIDDDPEAFEAHVRATAYAISMAGVHPEE
jgi:hypothetical protein